jgi:hypothetical protein
MKAIDLCPGEGKFQVLGLIVLFNIDSFSQILMPSKYPHPKLISFSVKE